MFFKSFGNKNQSVESLAKEVIGQFESMDPEVKNSLKHLEFSNDEKLHL